MSVSKVGWKRGESGGGCGGGSGEATLCGGGCGGESGEDTMDAGVKSDEAVTNFCPGRRVPSTCRCNRSEGVCSEGGGKGR